MVMLVIQYLDTIIFNFSRYILCITANFVYYGSSIKVDFDGLSLASHGSCYYCVDSIFLRLLIRAPATSRVRVLFYYEKHHVFWYFLPCGKKYGLVNVVIRITAPLLFGAADKPLDFTYLH